MITDDDIISTTWISLKQTANSIMLITPGSKLAQQAIVSANSECEHESYDIEVPEAQLSKLIPLVP